MKKQTLKKVTMMTAVVAVAGSMTACSTLSTTVIPQSQNKYTVVATARDSATVINGAIKKAQAVCTQQGKKLVVISHKTKYEGSGKKLGEVTSMLSSVAAAAGDVGLGDTKTNQDYKSTVVFECQ